MTRTATSRGSLLRRLTTTLTALAAVLGATALTAPAATAATCAGGFTCEGQSYGYRVIGSGVEYDSPRGRFTVATANGFRTEHARLGGGRGDLGYPTGPVVYQGWAAEGSPGWPGRYQTFERGVIYWNNFGGSQAIAVKGGASPFADTHARNGGGTGALGYPTGREVRQAGGYWYQEFYNGVVYVSPRGTHSVAGDLTWVHQRSGGGGGRLGYPTGPRVQQAAGYTYQAFERGVAYCGGLLRGAPECASVTGGFVGPHAGSGGGSGPLGYPVRDEYRCTDDDGRPYWEQFFERGYILIRQNGATDVVRTGSAPLAYCE